MTKPHRAVTLTLDMQADSRTDIIRGLLNVIHRIEREDMSTGASGGPTCGYRYSYHEHDGPTNDEYFRQVHDWLAEREGSGE